jgi:predicted transposase YdaD
LATWHDTLFRFTFAQVRHARALLRCLLPRRLAAAIDWRTLRPWPASGTGPDLRLRHGDLLFTARLRGSQVRVFFLIEHKSGPDPGLLRQLHRYVVHIASECAAGGATAPIVVPVVLHHGHRQLRVAPFATAPAPFAAFAPRLRVVIDDLARLGERELRARPLSALGRLTLLCLRWVSQLRDREVLAAIGRWGDLLRAAARARGGALSLEAIAAYILHQTDLSPARIAAAFARVIHQPGNQVMSTADRLFARGKAEGKAQGKAEGRVEGRVEGRAEGRAEGKVEGKVEGKSEIVRRLLTARFGPLPAKLAARLRAATDRDLDRWALRLLDAESLAEIFSGE